MSVGSRTLVLVASAVMAMTLVGCSNPTAGEPTGASTASETTSSEEPTQQAEPSFSNTQLCGLLTSDEAVQLGGAPNGEPKFSTMDGHPQCQWSNETSLVIGFQETGGTGKTPTGPGITNTETTVAGFPAVQSRNTNQVETCQVLVDITDKAVLGVSVANQSAGEGKYVPCDVAKQFAEIVIPKALDR